MVEVDLGASVAANQVDPLVARDGEDPAADRGLSLVVEDSAPPDRQHHLLHQILGAPVISAEAPHVGLYPRREVLEEQAKRRTFACLCDRFQHADILLVVGQRRV
jgi:hypothetical protein